MFECEAYYYALQTFTCPGGGSASGRARVEADGLFDKNQLMFAKCTWEDTRRDGFVLDFVTTDSNSRYRLDALTPGDSDGRSHTQNGGMSRTVVEDTGSGVGMRPFSVDVADYAVCDATDRFTLEDVETSLSHRRLCPRDHDCFTSTGFSATLTLRATMIDGGHEQTVETT